MNPSSAPFRRDRAAACIFAAAAALGAGGLPEAACGSGLPPPQRALITAGIDDRQTVTLSGNTRPEANAANDRGAVESALQIDHMQMLLKRPPALEQALQELMSGQLTAGSANYRHWLSARQFGALYGAAQQDLDTVTAWLEQKGFRVNQVNAGRTIIDFSGSAGQVKEAFGTEIHRLEVKGSTHIANSSDPKIPAALAPLVAGIVSLHDFRPHAGYRLRPAYTLSNFGETQQDMVPADLATIYNLNPLFDAGINGRGQTIALIEDGDIYSTADISSFRSEFGLGAAVFTQVHPAPLSGPNNCSDPGSTAADNVEAAIDVEWAGAAAPAAALQLTSCSDTTTMFGGLIAMQNLIEADAPPAIMSLSYSACETENGAAANAAYSAAYEQAAAEGISVFVDAGDSGAADCDSGAAAATDGIGINGFASTPYNVAVGGTDFSDTYSNTAGNYWSSSNGPTFGSAKSYIPEIPWNDSCASQLIASYITGSSLTYGSGGFCNNLTDAQKGYLTTTAAGGGPSGCATGASASIQAAASAVVGGSCAGTPKPSWQSVLGNPDDGVRDIPDVSLFASNGLWNHRYVFCFSASADGGAPCTGAPGSWSGAGGTSFSTPIMAGIQALVNQKIGASSGNPAPVYYQLARTEYGGIGSDSCNSSNGNSVGSACVFHDVTQGDMDVDCTGANDCDDPSGSYGVLSTASLDFEPAYGAATGWDFATGIGTINAANLVDSWPAPGSSSSSSGGGSSSSGSSSGVSGGSSGGGSSGGAVGFDVLAALGLAGWRRRRLRRTA